MIIVNIKESLLNLDLVVEIQLFKWFWLIECLISDVEKKRWPINKQYYISLCQKEKKKREREYYISYFLISWYIKGFVFCQFLLLFFISSILIQLTKYSWFKI